MSKPPTASELGSSPLVRGALNNSQFDIVSFGIIPARAGSTTRGHKALKVREDHPRSCGEHSDTGYFHVTLNGSSPLVRGAPCCGGHNPDRVGIIPARAGSTGRRVRGGDWKRDHPRSCGEHQGVVPCRPEGMGSSPLVRGALIGSADVFLLAGIIPARAGSTQSLRSDGRAPRDHPRSCGEHRACMRSCRSASGSSPLVRGALHQAVNDSRLYGIIPARAGSTSLPVQELEPGRDHPRSCGEHERHGVFPHDAEGSSPLVRGAPRNGGLSIVPARIIPARAGSTACNLRPVVKV